MNCIKVDVMDFALFFYTIELSMFTFIILPLGVAEIGHFNSFSHLL